MLQLVLKDAPRDAVDVEALSWVASGQVDVLQKLQLLVGSSSRQGIAPFKLDQALQEIGFTGDLDSAQYLRRLGAAWPAHFVGEEAQLLRIPPRFRRRHYSDFAAASVGHHRWYGWLGWSTDDCRKLANNYHRVLGVQNTPAAFAAASVKDLLEWIHGNGCPCRCARPWHMPSKESVEDLSVFSWEDDDINSDDDELEYLYDDEDEPRMYHSERLRMCNGTESDAADY